VISVAVLASTPMTRARLEALVAARPGLRLTKTPVSGSHATGAGTEADVLLVDPGTRRLEAVLRTLPPVPRLPPVVLLTGDIVLPASSRLLRAGVRAILPRDASAPEIVAGIEAVAAGLVVLHPSAVLVAATQGPSARRAGGDTGFEPLTRRELEVLGMMAEGMGNRAIAQHLKISTHTVKFHIAAILEKLNARSRTEAVTTGVRRGLLMV
jgi:two-component system, NarL family, response regulator YdfI